MQSPYGLLSGTGAKYLRFTEMVDQDFD